MRAPLDLVSADSMPMSTPGPIASVSSSSSSCPGAGAGGAPVPLRLDDSFPIAPGSTLEREGRAHVRAFPREEGHTRNHRPTAEMVVCVDDPRVCV